MIKCNEETWLRHIDVIIQYAKHETKEAQKRWGGPNVLAITSREACIENGKKGGRPKHGAKKPKTKRVALMIEMLKEQFPLNDIAEELGVTREAVDSARRRYGIEYAKRT